jgi:hypothetical protein
LFSDIRAGDGKIVNLFYSAVLTKTPKLWIEKEAKESVSRDAFGAEFAGMAAKWVDDGFVAVHSDGCQRENAGVHTHVLK